MQTKCSQDMPRIDHISRQHPQKKLLLGLFASMKDGSLLLRTLAHQLEMLMLPCANFALCYVLLMHLTPMQWLRSLLIYLAMSVKWPPFWRVKMAMDWLYPRTWALSLSKH